MDTIRTFLAEKALRNNAKTALWFQGQQLSYDDLERLSNRIANVLVEEGIASGDHVALMLPNGPEYIGCWFALAKLGAVTVAVNTAFQGEALSHLLRQSDSSAVILANCFRSGWEVMASDLSSIRCLDWDGSPNGLAAKYPDCASTLSVDWPLTDTQPLILTSTSGTTGMPKLVVNSHRTYLKAAEDLSHATAMTPDDRIFTALPLYHANPQVYCVLTALAANASMALAPRFSASAFWSQVRESGATAFTYVGSVLPILLSRDSSPADRDHKVRKCFGGGAPKPVYEAFQKRFDIEILELYGMSETGTWNTINRPGQGRPGCVGTAREGFDIQIVDNADSPLPPGVVGEIVIRPQMPFIMFDGYYRDPEESFSCSRNWWFHTGDLGAVDTDGYYSFHGRKKESIRRGGENIAPETIERVANTHPAVAESAAVGVPDDILYEEIRLFAVGRTEQRLAPADLAEHCARDLPKFMRPRYIDIVDVLPKSASEKIQRLRIKERPLEEATYDTMAEGGSTDK